MQRQSKPIVSHQKKIAVASEEEKLPVGLYDKDFYRWTSTQSKLLQKGEYSKLDIQNLIEEIDALGRSERRALESYLEILLMHMLKEKFQSKRKTASWELSIRNSRLKASKVLKQNPSLKSKLDEVVKDAYESARLDAALETGLDEKIFPEECPWDIKELI